MKKRKMLAVVFIPEGVFATGLRLDLKVDKDAA